MNGDRSGWAVRGKHLASDVSNCTAILTYSTELVRPGSVTFTYQHEDDSILFTFEVFTLEFVRFHPSSYGGRVAGDRLSFDRN